MGLAILFLVVIIATAYAVFGGKKSKKKPKYLKPGETLKVKGVEYNCPYHYVRSSTKKVVDDKGDEWFVPYYLYLDILSVGRSWEAEVRSKGSSTEYNDPWRASDTSYDNHYSSDSYSDSPSSYDSSDSSSDFGSFE